MSGRADVQNRRTGVSDFTQSARARLRTNRPVQITAAAISVAIVLIQLPVLWQAVSDPNLNVGADYQLYMEATRRWAQGGPFYEPYQLAGPYTIRHGDVLYPPVALLLFLPFTLLPAALWWAIPIATTLAILLRLRPSVVVWPVMAACVGWQPAQLLIINGNPVLWVMTAVGLGTIFRWPYVFALIKPTLFVFALVGARDPGGGWRWPCSGPVCPVPPHVARLARCDPERTGRHRPLLLVAGSDVAPAAARRVAGQVPRPLRAWGASVGRVRISPPEVQIAQ